MTTLREQFIERLIREIFQWRLRRLAKAAQLTDALARWRESRCRFA
jgi:hypothetical protein